MENMLNFNERAFSFIQVNQRESIPRTRGITEIRAPATHRLGKLFAGYIRNHGDLCGRAEVCRRLIFFDGS